MTLPLDDPGRGPEIRALIARKPALRDWYQGVYAFWREQSRALEMDGPVIELGAGAGFSDEAIPGIVRTDLLAYPGLDQVADAQALPWADASVKALCLLNVLHHLPDPALFLAEAQRVLKPGGLLLLTEPHVGPLSWWVYRFLHHEPLDLRARDWAMPVEHALAGANSAQAWIIFVRDRARFDREFPGLRLLGYRRFSPLQYWLSGGLKAWTLVPAALVPLVRAIDRLLIAVWPGSASYCHVVLRREARS